MAKMTDVQRTALLLDLVAERHVTVQGKDTPMNEKAIAARQVFVTEVASHTGFHPGYADALGLSVWQSDGFVADGYEIKASRADLKRELTDLSKWERVGRYCDRWWLVVWDERWLDDPAIPPEWGLLAYSDADRDLKLVRRATKRDREDWPVAFVAAVVRRAAEASPCAALLSRMADVAFSKGRREGMGEERNRQSLTRRKQLEPLLEAYREVSRWSSEVPLDWVVGEFLRMRAALRPTPRTDG